MKCRLPILTWNTGRKLEDVSAKTLVYINEDENNSRKKMNDTAIK